MSSAEALAAYVAALDDGLSTLVHSSGGHPGLDVAVAQVAALSSRPLVTTDLSGPVHAVAGRGNLRDDAVDEPVLAFHTSGSTGHPKCVVYRRSVVDAHADLIADRLGLADDGPTYAALPPPGFAYGLSIVHSHRRRGVPVRFVDPTWGLPQLGELPDGPLALYALPQHAPALLSSDVEARRVHRIIVAGGRLSGAAARALADRFPEAGLTNMYGQAELGPRLSMWSGRPADFAEGTIGRPLPGVDLEVRADDGETGPIFARTPYAMYRYIPAPYTEVLEGPGADFVATGDRGRLLPDGSLRHEGRGDHVINVAGTKIDGQLVRSLVEEAFAPLVVRVDSRPAKVGGDRVPVIQIVPGHDTVRPGAVRRALHTEFGSVAALCDIRIVERLEVGASGK